MKHVLLIVALSLLVPLLDINAQTKDSVSYVLDPVVVTASQVDALRSTVPNAVSVIAGVDLHQSGETSVLTLLNQKVPGVFVTERGVLGYGVSTGAAGGISIRGTGGSPNTEVLILTDGRPQWMGLMGHPLPDTYVNSGIERVEVIRGPASLMHGTNAMGGVINIIREKPETDGLNGSFGTSYGSYNTEKYEGSIGYGKSNMGLTIDGNYYETSGHRAYSSFKENNGTVRGWTVLSELFTLKADASVSGFRAYDPGTVASPYVNHWQDILRGSSGFALENHAGSVEGAVKGFFNWGVHDIYDGFHSKDRNVGIMAYEGFHPLADNTTTVGFDYKRYGGSANAGTTQYGEHHVDETGGYVLTQQHFLNLVTASAGVRLNHHSITGYEAVPQFGVAVNTDAQTTIKANVGKGFRSPTIREMFLFPAPNPNLAPERMWNYEAGVLRTFLDNLANVELTAFITKGTNQIRTTGTYPNMKLSNSGSFTHHGMEFAGSVRPTYATSFDVTYSYLERGDQTAANPKHKASISGTYVMFPATFTVGFQYVSGLYGDDYSRSHLPDYGLLSARVTVAVMHRLSVYVAGENLLDRPYQILTGYVMPGRVGFAGLTWEGL